MANFDQDGPAATGVSTPASEASGSPTGTPGHCTRLLGDAAEFSESEFWALVRRLSGYQTKTRLRDAAFCRLHPGVGSPSSWRLLKLLAEEKHLDLSRWYARLRTECDAIERTGVQWMDTASGLPDAGQRGRLEIQELHAKIESWRTAKGMNQAQFVREFSAYTGDAATWTRMRQGKWHSLNVPKWLAKLRELSRLLSAR